MNRTVTWSALTLLIITVVRVHALTDAEKCEAAKNKIAGKYAFCRQKAEAKAIKTGAAPDFSQCDAKLGLKWGTAEANGGGMCPTNGDQSPMQGCITAHTGNVAAALSVGACRTGGLPETGQTQCDPGDNTLAACPGSPAGQDGETQPELTRSGSLVDNGDGTVSDTITGLVWEKLSDDGSIHDKDDFYKWYDASDTKLASLNSGGGFAGHTDWRLPNVIELQSIVNYGASSPSAYSQFNTGCVPGCAITTCSCTPLCGYWTSSSNPIGAWDVDTDGIVLIYTKISDSCVRAVRGGS